jgi:hypothetical protein
MSYDLAHSERDMLWGRTATTLSTPGYEHVLLRVPVNSPATILRAKDPLEADDCLRTTKSKFSLLHCIEYQKNLYAAQ